MFRLTMMHSASPPLEMLRVFLVHPSASLLALVLAIAAGVYLPEFSKSIGVLGDIYIDLLTMIVLPFLLATITTSIARLFYEDRLSQNLGRVVVWIAGFTVFAAAMGVLFAVLLQPGLGLGADNIATMGQLIKQSSETIDLGLEMDLFLPYQGNEATGTGADIFRNFIPDNIFAALSEGESLKVLIFTAIFGTALGTLPKRYGDGFLGSMQAVYFTSQKIMRWMTVILPLALFVMVADQVANVGYEPILATWKYVIGLTVVSMVLLLLCVMLLARRAQIGLFEALAVMRDPFLLALGTRNSLACIPSINKALAEDLRFDSNMVELVSPLAIALCRIGPAVFFAFTGVFIAQLYNVELSLGDYAVVAGAAVLATFASVGTTGVVTLTLISLACAPLGLPTEAVFALLLAVEPVTDVLRTTLIVVGNVTVTAYVCNQPEDGDYDILVTTEGSQRG